MVKVTPTPSRNIDACLKALKKRTHSLGLIRQSKKSDFFRNKRSVAEYKRLGKHLLRKSLTFMKSKALSTKDKSIVPKIDLEADPVAAAVIETIV